MIAAVNSNSYINVETEQVSVRSLFSRIQEAIHTAFTTLKAIKWELGYLTLGALAAVVLGVSWKVALVAWLVGTIYYSVVKVKQSGDNQQYFQLEPLEFNLKKDKYTVRQIFNNLMETKWGKRWLKMEKLGSEDAFEKVYQDLYKGTCTGQTLALIKLMPTHAAKPGEDLLKGIKFTEAVENQLTHKFRVKLHNCNNSEEAKKIYTQITDPSHLDKKVAKVAAAMTEAKQAEDLMAYSPSICAQEQYVLQDPIGKEARFQNALKAKLAAFQSKYPQYVVAANIGLKFQDTGHSIFVQFNGGYCRLYDINHGLYQFPNQELLVSGIYRHFGQYQDEKIREVVVRFFLVNSK